MPINQLVEFCLEKYNKQGRCIDCKNDCKCIGTDDCYLCLNYIHQINTLDRTYNCKNITYNYILKHFYRYSSEIERLFNSFESLKRVQYFKVASIGCGPCSELFGIKQFFANNNISPRFEYIGFDFNTQWNEIQNKIVEIFGEGIQFSNENIFAYYEQYPDKLPNVLILNYVLSDIVKFNRAGVEDFVNSLIDLFDKMPNSCIIINDISYYERNLQNKGTWRAVNYMNYIYDSLVNTEKVTYSKNKYYFVPQLGSGLTYGIRHQLKLLTSEVVSKAYLFSPFPYCGSFQLLIFKRYNE